MLIGTMALFLGPRIMWEFSFTSFFVLTKIFQEHGHVGQ